MYKKGQYCGRKDICVGKSDVKFSTKLRVPGQKLYIDFQRNFIHNYKDVNLFLIIPKEKTKTVAGKDWCI
jgi:hypothetical protein